MRHLSYKFRIPLSLVVSALLTSLVLGLAISFETYRNIVQDRITEGSRLSHALAPVLTQALKHDDVWLAYSLLRGPALSETRQGSVAANIMILINENTTVFASNRPWEYHTGSPIKDHTPLYQDLIVQTSNHLDSTPMLIELEDQLIMASGLFSEDAYRGALIIVFPVQTFWTRFFEIVNNGLWVIGLVLIPLILLGWYWGRHMVAPLTHLSNCMIKMRTGNVDNLECRVYQGADEIGELGKQFQQMLSGLKEKHLLEQQVIAQERLAAIGRLTASVAHEINNPVGGMLVALDTWWHRSEESRDIEKLLALIERGLDQIKGTVSALLVESRVEKRQLEPHDIEDVRTLLAAQSLPPGANLFWESRVQKKINLPASAIRQILMNLVANALQAIGPDEEVIVTIELEDSNLKISVSDNGKPIPPEIQSHLFEPFLSYREGGTGLGLWITYQLVEQLHGAIEVVSESGLTRFSVKLPVDDVTENIVPINREEKKLSYCVDRG